MQFSVDNAVIWQMVVMLYHNELLTKSYATQHCLFVRDSPAFQCISMMHQNLTWHCRADWQYSSMVSNVRLQSNASGQVMISHLLYLITWLIAWSCEWTASVHAFLSLSDKWQFYYYRNCLSKARETNIAEGQVIGSQTPKQKHNIWLFYNKTIVFVVFITHSYKGYLLGLKVDVSGATWLIL